MATIPMLGEDAWLNASSKNASLGVLFSYFICSDYDQSETFKGETCSFAYILMHCDNDVPMVVNVLQETLKKYIGRYFPVVNCEVRDVTNPNTLSKSTITIYLSVTDIDGVSTDLAKAVDFQDGKLKKILDINNYGV